MTCREKLEKMNPGCKVHDVIDEVCPSDLGYLEDPYGGCNGDCETCWDREIPEEDLCDNCSKLGNVVGTNEKMCPHMYRTFTEKIVMCEYHEPVSSEEELNEFEKATIDFVSKQLKNSHDPVKETVQSIFRDNNEEILKEPVDVTIGDIPLQDISYDGVEPCSIKDSGARREFATGAVRDIQEGKGRCDLLPLDVVACFLGSPGLDNNILYNIRKFTTSNDICYLYNALDEMSLQWNDGKTKESYERIVKQRRCGMILEVSKHFEEGAKKYGEYNWQKGIPTHCYIDSAVRHYLKYLRGDKDEPHDRAFVWNILCCIWTCIHKPELNDYGKKDEKNG